MCGNDETMRNAAESDCSCIIFPRCTIPGPPGVKNGLFSIFHARSEGKEGPGRKNARHEGTKRVER